MGGGDSLDSDFGTMVDGTLSEDLGQSLVFTNSHHNGRVATHSYAHATANSYAHAASSGGGGGNATYAHAALVHSAFIYAQTHLCLHVCLIWFKKNHEHVSLFIKFLCALLVVSSWLWLWVLEHSQACGCNSRLEIFRAALRLSSQSEKQPDGGAGIRQRCRSLQRCRATSVAEPRPHRGEGSAGRERPGCHPAQ